MKHENLQESLHCVWFKHGIHFSSRIREEYDNDSEMRELCNKFEESWRALYNKTLEETEREKIEEQFKKKVLYPVIKEEMKKLL